jgi:hypothetical protein
VDLHQAGEGEAGLEPDDAVGVVEGPEERGLELWQERLQVLANLYLSN